MVRLNSVSAIGLIDCIVKETVVYNCLMDNTTFCRSVQGHQVERCIEASCYVNCVMDQKKYMHT